MSEGDGRDDCLGKALDLLARRAHFRGELRRKLAARGFGPDSIEAALARASELGYLGSEEQLAVAFARERQERRGLGRSRIAQELARRHATPEAIEAALADVDPEAELARAREAAARWARHGSGAAALARHLARKGFARSVIFRVSREFAPDGEELPTDGD
ncbi:MAG: regulatory protein RecX [Acidobacteria bacterium]|nr:regulatory protein RecX [Acidobacteriota bacterium]MCB9377230.1 regulatory protein RecX [Holophagales bacterium]